MDLRPTHVVLEVGDRATACGLRDKSRYPQTPYLLARFMAKHEAGHRAHGVPLEWCPACLAVVRP